MSLIFDLSWEADGRTAFKAPQPCHRFSLIHFLLVLLSTLFVMLLLLNPLSPLHPNKALFSETKNQGKIAFFISCNMSCDVQLLRQQKHKGPGWKFHNFKLYPSQQHGQHHSSCISSCRSFTTFAIGQLNREVPSALTYLSSVASANWLPM